MTEFLTENARRAYPLEREMPQGTPPLWTCLLLDACVGADAGADPGGGGRLSLLSAAPAGSEVQLEMGVPDGASCTAHIGRGLGGRAVVFAEGNGIKALLTVDGRVVDAILDDEETYDDAVDVNVPFALRCAAGGPLRRVESLEAYGVPPCTRKAFDPAGETPVRSVAGGDAVLAAGDGVDLEVVGMAPLEGRLLRVSAIAAPAESAETPAPVDLMIRGDACFTVESTPPAGGEPGRIKIGNACKPCCQCDDYKAVLDALRGHERGAAVVKMALDDARARYNAALQAFNKVKEAALTAVNSRDNVRARAVAATGAPGYSQSEAAGTRARIAVTLYVENLTQLDASVNVTGFTVPGYDPVQNTARWTLVTGGATTSGSGLPVAKTLAPGGTLTVTATYATTSTSNTAVRPSGMQAGLTVQLDGQAEPAPRSVPVTEASS